MKKEKVVNFLLFAFPLLALVYIYRGVIFFGGIFANQDVIYNYIPYYFSILKGHLIEPSILGGFPVYTTMQATWFSPVTRIALDFLEPVNAYILVNLVYVTLTYVFCYLFAKKINFEHRVAIAIATMYVFSGQLMLWSHTPLITLYHFSLPALFYLFEVFKTEKRAYLKVLVVALMGGLLGLGWISGHVQFNVYVHTIFFIYIISSSFFVQNNGDKHQLRKNLLLNALLVFVIAGISFVIGFPQIDAVLSTQPLSVRSGGVALSETYNLGYAPYTLIQYLLPSFRIFYPPVWQSLHNYIGLFPLVLLIFWFIYLRKKYTKITHKLFYFFLAVFIFCLLISLEKSPLAMLTHYVPFYNSFRESVRLMFIGDFALAIIFGFILKKITETTVADFSPAWTHPLVYLKNFLYFVLIPFFALITIVKIFFFSTIENALKNYFLVHQFKNTVGHYPLEHYYTLLHLYLDRDLSQLTLMSAHVISLLVFLFLVLLLLQKKSFLNQKTFLAFVIILMTLDCASVYADRFPMINKKLLMTQSHTEAFILAREKSKIPDYRYLTVLGGVALPNEAIRCAFPDLNNWNFSPQEFELRKELIDANSGIYAGVQAADGYEPFMTSYAGDMDAYIGSRTALSAHPLNNISVPTLEEKIQKIIERKNVIKSQNVKYVISPYKIEDPDFVQVFTETVGECKTPIFLYELQNFYPRYFLTNTAEFQQSLDFKTTVEKLQNSATPVIIIHSASTTSLSTLTKKIITPVFPTREDDVVDFSVANPEKTSQFLFLGLTWTPGWHATIDGVSASVLRANYSSMAVVIPSGSHTVQLTYSPLSLIKK